MGVLRVTIAMPERPEPLSAPIRRSILLLSLAAFSSMLAQRICDPMLPEIARSFSVSLTQAAQVVSVFAVIYGLSQLVYGPLGDRLAKFRIVSLATLACCLGSVLAVFAASLEWLLLARVLVAMAAAAIIPLSLAWVGDTVEPAGLQACLARIGLGTTMGVVAGQLVGGLLVDTLGWRWAFVFMTLLFGVAGALLMRDWRLQQAVPGWVLRRRPAGGPGFVAQAFIILTGPWSRLVLLVAFIEGITGFGVVAIWASHLHRSLGLALSAAGAIVALYGVGGMLYMALARHLIRRLNEEQLATLGICMAGLSALVLGFAPFWWLTAPASLLAGFGFFMFHNTLQAKATQMAPEARATAVSLFALSLFLGQSVGVLLASSLLERIGSSMVVALSGGALGAVGLLFARALSRRQAKLAAG